MYAYLFCQKITHSNQLIRTLFKTRAQCAVHSYKDRNCICCVENLRGTEPPFNKLFYPEAVGGKLFDSFCRCGIQNVPRQGSK